jgi:nicotinamidase-related amidase
VTDPTGPLLAVIDMQRIFGDADSEWWVPRFGEIVEPVRRMVAAFGDRVVFTRFVAPAVPTGSWRDYYRRWPFALRPPDAPMYQVADAFRPVPEPTLDATTFGKWGDGLAARLGDAGVLVLAGVSTDCCVLGTALAAADAGVRVLVAADACAGAGDSSHEQTLAILRLYAPQIEVRTVDDLLLPTDNRAGTDSVAPPDVAGRAG